MEKYIGIRMVDAEPMNKYEFCMNIKGIDCKEENKEGYLVRYEDGHVNWSCKEAFEIAYSKIDNCTLNFSEALFFIKQGLKIARKGWNNPNIWLELQRPDANSKMTMPYIYMVKYNNKFPCDLSCESFFAEDWMVIE